jgi:hypothetical protein
MFQANLFRLVQPGQLRPVHVRLVPPLPRILHDKLCPAETATASATNSIATTFTESAASRAINSVLSSLRPTAVRLTAATSSSSSSLATLAASSQHASPSLHQAWMC